MEKKIRSELIKMYGIMVVLIGIGIYAHDFVIDGIMAKASLNLSIFGLFGVAAAIAFRHVILLRNEVVALKALQVDFGHRRLRPVNPYNTPAIVFREPDLLGQGYRMITEELGRQDDLQLSNSSVQTLLHDVDQRINDRRSSIMYFSGLMVFLGLLGAFMGLMKTVGSVGDLIGGMDISGNAGTDSFGKMIEGMKAPLNGMSVGFSSSLFGLMTSMVLGALERCMTSAMKTLRNEYEHWLYNQAALEGGPGETSVKAVVDMTPLRRPMEQGTAQIKDMRDLLAESLESKDEVRNAISAMAGAIERLGGSVDALADPRAMLAPVTEAVADLARNQTEMLGLFKTIQDQAASDRMQMRALLEDIRVTAASTRSLDGELLHSQFDRLIEAQHSGAVTGDAFAASAGPVERSGRLARMFMPLFAMPAVWRSLREARIIRREARAIRREVRLGLMEQQRSLQRIDRHLDARIDSIDADRQQDRETLLALAQLATEQQDRLVALAERLVLAGKSPVNDSNSALRDARAEMAMLSRRLDARIEQDADKVAGSAADARRAAGGER